MAIDFGRPRNESAWHPEPNHRGTYSLLSSCLITMALCVWTAVHFNLPEHGKPGRQTWRKVGWLLVGVFAPEIVVWVAFEQYREAKALRDKVKQVLGQDFPPSSVTKIRSWFRRRLRLGSKSATDQESAMVLPAAPRYEWTMAHSQFAVMGGFAFESDVLPGRNRAVLTSLGVLRLAQVTPHLLPNVSKEQINDKSKANWLVKTIVVLQTLWFSTQCVHRLAVGLPISLLELNTFAHAICALMAYALWWHKPLDVQEPVLIQGTDAAMVGAGMSMRSSMGANCVASGHYACTLIVARLWRVGETTDFIWDQRDSLVAYLTRKKQKVDLGLMESLVKGLSNAESMDDVYSQVNQFDDDPLESVPNSLDTGAANNPPACRLYMGQSMFGFGFRRGTPFCFQKPPFLTSSFGQPLPQALVFFTPRETKFEPVAKHGIMSVQRPFIELASTDISRLRLAQNCYGKYPRILERPAHKRTLASSLALQRDLSKYLYKIHREHLNEYVVPRIRNFPLWDGSCKGPGDGSPFTSMICGLAVAGAAYGGLHLLAWNPPIDDLMLVYIWRLSGVVVAGYGFYLLSIPSFERLVKKTEVWLAQQRPLWIAVIVTDLGMTFRAVIFVMAAAFGIVYIIGRIYLLVESVWSVPRSPDSVFVTTDWSRYFVHLT